jgi:hypothetical protein
MTHKPKHFTLIDPRELDGDPFDAAEKACQQAAGLAKLLQQALDGAVLMARNAEFERQLQSQKKVNVEAWDNGPSAKLFSTLKNSVAEVESKTTMLSKASGYNPKNHPKE